MKIVKILPIALIVLFLGYKTWQPILEVIGFIVRVAAEILLSIIAIGIVLLLYHKIFGVDGENSEHTP